MSEFNLCSPTACSRRALGLLHAMGEATIGDTRSCMYTSAEGICGLTSRVESSDAYPEGVVRTFSTANGEVIPGACPLAVDQEIADVAVPDRPADWL